MPSNPFDFLGGRDPEIPRLQARIITLEARVDKHREAHRKTNDLLKECIRRIEALEDRT